MSPINASETVKNIGCSFNKVIEAACVSPIPMTKSTGSKGKGTNVKTTGLRPGGIYSISTGNKFKHATKDTFSVKKQPVDVLVFQSSFPTSPSSPDARSQHQNIAVSPPEPARIETPKAKVSPPEPARIEAPKFTASPPEPLKIETPTKEQVKNFPWTPRDLRRIFPKGKTTPGSNKSSKRESKKKSSKHVERDGLKQLRLFEMKNLGSDAGHIGENAISPSQKSAGEIRAGFGHQGNSEESRHFEQKATCEKATQSCN